MRKRIFTICLAAFAGVLAAACGSEEPPAPSPTVAPVQSAIDFKIGNNIGDRIPDFEIVLTDGSPITSAGLLQNGRPAFLFFFATTWTICRSELRSLKDIWPEYADAVDFYAINVDPSDDLETLENFGKNQGYPWPMADSDSEVLFKLHVTNQSTKVAFGADGIIVYREKMGGGGPDVWRGIFEELSSGA